MGTLFFFFAKFSLVKIMHIGDLVLIPYLKNKFSTCTGKKKIKNLKFSYLYLKKYQNILNMVSCLDMFNICIR